jgi:MAF protein
MGLKFETSSSELKETPTQGLSPEEQATSYARAKASKVAKQFSKGTVIAADTIVVFNNEMLGKPAAAEEAAEMLKQLRGKRHQVMTAVAITDAASGETLSDFRSSQVTMRNFTDQEIVDYVNSGSPLDKAGAYGIQDKSFNPVAKVKDCYLNVVGLPVCLLMELLLKLGVHPTITPNWHSPDDCPECRKWQSA